jgi:RNA 2',3'-cyclic 3'-phosphodiesterase
VRRLFIALKPGGGVADMLKVPYGELIKKGTNLKVVPPDNYHITLKFFGNCADDLAASIESGFRGRSPEPAAGLPFKLTGLGAFPDIKKANVIWCGMDAGEEAGRIYGFYDDFGTKFGFAREKRAFRPHLTLARVRMGAGIPPELADYISGNRDTVFGESSFSGIILYSSTLTPKGPLYSEVHSIKL